MMLFSEISISSLMCSPNQHILRSRVVCLLYVDRSLFVDARNYSSALLLGMVLPRHLHIVPACWGSDLMPRG